VRLRTLSLGDAVYILGQLSIILSIFGLALVEHFYPSAIYNFALHEVCDGDEHCAGSLLICVGFMLFITFTGWLNPAEAGRPLSAKPGVGRGAPHAQIYILGANGVGVPQMRGEGLQRLRLRFSKHPPDLPRLGSAMRNLAPSIYHGVED